MTALIALIALIALTSLITGIVLGTRFTRASIGMDSRLADFRRDVDVSDAADMSMDGAL